VGRGCHRFANPYSPSASSLPRRIATSATGPCFKIQMCFSLCVFCLGPCCEGIEIHLLPALYLLSPGDSSSDLWDDSNDFCCFCPLPLGARYLTPNPPRVRTHVSCNQEHAHAEMYLPLLFVSYLLSIPAYDADLVQICLLFG
jgi:hypothetical protein